MYWFAFLGLLISLSNVTCDILSIDIGNQFFKVALVSTGKFEIVHNLQSKRKTPTALSFKSAIRNFGDDALIDAAKNPSKVVSFFRRLVGASGTAVDAKDLYLSEFAPSFAVTADPMRHSIIFGNDDFAHRGIEETVAHIIWYAKNLVEEHDTVGSGRHKIGSLKDLVLVVPSWATQRERQAVLDASTIAGFPRDRVTLVHETSAAAVQRGFDLDLALNGTKEVTAMFLNMGSTHFESCIVQYGLYGNKTTTPTAKVMGCAHSFKAGGSEITRDIAREALEFFSLKNPKKSENFKKDEIAKVRVLRQAESVKHTLSANKEALFSVESLFDEIDFRKPFSRADIERMAVPVMVELESTITRVLEKTGLLKSEIDQVEIIGGGWRVPCIQEKLEALVAPLPLGQHLNGDESIVFGAAFIAANSSSNFRVRKIMFTDIIENEFALSISSSEEETPRRQIIFPSGHKLNSVKAIKLTTDSDLSVDLSENGVILESFSITGRNVSAPVKPQIVLKLKLDGNGIVHLLGADAIYEYEQEEEVRTLIEKDEADPDEPVEYNVSTQMLSKKDKVGLKIESTFRQVPLPMSEDDIKEVKAKLRGIIDEEDRIKLKTKVKNDLESLIYSIRDKMADDTEILENSTVEERTAAVDASYLAETWFDDNAWGATVDDLKEQIQLLKQSMEPITAKLQEKRRLEEVARKEIEDAKKAIEKARLEAEKLKAEEEAAKLLEELERIKALNETDLPNPEDTVLPEDDEFDDVIEDEETDTKEPGVDEL